MSRAGNKAAQNYVVGVLHHTGQLASTRVDCAQGPVFVLDQISDLLAREVRRMRVRVPSTQIRSQLKRAGRDFSIGRTFWFTVRHDRIGDFVAYAVPADEKIELRLPKPPMGRAA